MTQWVDVQMQSNDNFIVAVEDLDEFIGTVEGAGIAFIALPILISNPMIAAMFPGEQTNTIYVRAEQIKYIMPRSDDPAERAKGIIAAGRDDLAKPVTPPPLPEPGGAQAPMTAQERERLLSSGQPMTAEQLAKLIGRPIQ